MWYAKNPDHYTFNYDAIDRIPYMAPGLVTKEKAARGKTPTDVWWQTIVPTNSRERTGYPAQKPLAILERIVKVHSNPGDLVLDFFAGSGTTGEAAARNDRRYILIDNNSQAVELMCAAYPSVSRPGHLARSRATHSEHQDLARMVHTADHREIDSISTNFSSRLPTISSKKRSRRI